MNKTNIKIVVGVLIAFASGGCAHQKVAAVDSSLKKPVIRHVSELTLAEASRIAKANVIELNKMPISGDWYEAIIQFPNENKGIVYIEADKKHMIAGAIFDARTGVNLTAQKMTKMGVMPPPPSVPVSTEAAPSVPPKIDPKVVSVSLAKIKKQTKVFHYGKAGGEPLTVFVDPQCPYCHRAWPDVMKLSKSNPVDVVVVGYLGPQSEEMAAFINKGDAGGLDKVMRGKKPGLNDKQGDIKVIRDVSAAAVNMGVSGVPAFSRKGLVVTGFSGVGSIKSLLN